MQLELNNIISRCFFVILGILILVKLYELLDLNNAPSKSQNNNVDIIRSNHILNKIRDAEEKGIREAFENIEIEYQNSFLDKSDDYKLLLFYKTSCPYSRKFLPVWYKIINNLPKNIVYEEIEADKDTAKSNLYGILNVPSVVLLVSGQKNLFVGQHNYENIKRFLAKNGVNLVERRFENFNEVGNINSDLLNMDTGTGGVMNANCPVVTFDKYENVEDDMYRYQIFNSEGQYGYAEGGFKDDKIMTPYQAAYSTVDSYLSSLPDFENIGKSSMKNVDECAGLYSKDIINFGLCDKKELEKISNYKKSMEKGESSVRIPGTNYENNEKIVNAIKSVCGMN